jgi:predicted Zn-dependent protease
MPDETPDSLFFQASPISISSIQRKCAECEEEKKVQMKGEAIASGGMTAPSIVNKAINSRGQPLARSTKNFMEPKFGYDFSNVQIHNDSLAHQSSKDINAFAYTHGNHVVFGAGQYQPDTPRGKKLLAHELAHVVQQRSIHSKTIQEKVVDDDKHVTCRFGRPNAVAVLRAAEGEAARMADNAALALRRDPISETTRASLWRQFKVDYNEPIIRCKWVPRHS